LSWHSAFASRGPRRYSHATSSALVAIEARIPAYWSVWPLSGMIAKVPQNSGFCTSGQDRGGGERIGSALADSVSAWPGCEVGIRVVLGRRRPVYVGGFG
jgi:hypothetical protein